tara:strand:- start:5261 stop:5515 length:255 start_codon:yes stop_codon:yes gene_type:complete
MKLTKSNLKQLIKESLTDHILEQQELLETLLKEGEYPCYQDEKGVFKLINPRLKVYCGQGSCSPVRLKAPVDPSTLGSQVKCPE